MDVIEFIDKNHKVMDFPSKHVHFLNHPKDLKELVKVSLSELPHPYPEYASWLLLHVTKSKPELVEPFQGLIIDRLLVSTNQSVLKNLMAICELLPLIEYKESEFLDKLIDNIKDDSNKVALFVYSIYKLIQFTKKYPEIKPEIEGIISLKEEPMKPAMKIGIRRYLKETGINK